MVQTKNAYLKKITENIRMKSTKVGKELDGTTPPSVFIGAWNYPKVYAGPMMSSQQGDTSIMDSPESWIDEKKTQPDILKYRLNLVRGKQLVGIHDLENKFVTQLQEISLSTHSIDSEAKFGKRPRGLSFNSDAMPHGPSAVIEKFDIDNVKWDHQLEKKFYDTDAKASEAVMELHKKDVPFSHMQKAFSVGAFGERKRRKLVPTRWSITACDTTLANNFLKNVRTYDIIDTYRVYEYKNFNNYFAVILMPMEWQYEAFEAFIQIYKNEKFVFSDYETNSGKKEYSSIGGCYYTCKNVILDNLEKEKKQAGAIVLREAYSDYIPLGVFTVRENMKYAMWNPYKEFETLRDCLKYLGGEFKTPMKRFIETSNLLNELLHTQQTTLDAYFKK